MSQSSYSVADTQGAHLISAKPCGSRLRDPGCKTTVGHAAIDFANASLIEVLAWCAARHADTTETAQETIGPPARE